MVRKPFPSVDPLKRSSKPMQLIHTDVVGPLQARSHSGKRYAIVFTDDYTRWSEIHFMALKSEAPAKFQLFSAKIEKYGKIEMLRTDGGGEYGSSEFTEYLRMKGIEHQITAPYSPASNGISERTNRGFLDPLRCMLKHSGLPLTFWAEAAAVAIYIKNRLPHCAIVKRRMSPFEALNGEKPHLGHIRVFGCTAYVHIPVETGRQKLDDRAKKCIFIGYTETTSIWRLYDLASKRVMRSRDVKFLETSFPFRTGSEIPKSGLDIPPAIYRSEPEEDSDYSDAQEAPSAAGPAQAEQPLRTRRGGGR